MELTGQVALVTGASSGIGEATARKLVAEGCNVALAARRKNQLEAIADDIGAQRVLPVPTDVTDEEDIAAMVEQRVDAFGGIDILVNSAGVVLPNPVVNADQSGFRQQIEVNLLALMNVTHAVSPAMLDSGGGDIVVDVLLDPLPPVGVLAAVPSEVVGAVGGVAAEAGPRDAVDGIVIARAGLAVLVVDGTDVCLEEGARAGVEPREVLPAAHGWHTPSSSAGQSWPRSSM